MKTKFRKMIVVWGVINLLLLVFWLALFLVIREKNKTFALLTQVDQSGINNSIEATLFNNQANQALVESYFLTSSSTVVFLESLEELGQQTKVNLNIGQALEQTGQLSLSLSAEADFDHLTKFLNSLELLPYAVRVNRVELRKGEKVWSGNFSLIVLQKTGDE